MTVTERVTGVLALRPSVFEDIEADKHANAQAFAVVVIGTVAAGLGGGQYGGLSRMVLESIGAVVGLITWAALTYLLGVRLLFRVMGYATAPTFFAAFGAVPIVGRAVPFVVSVWLLATFTIGVRQALDYRSTIRAVIVVMVGWLFWVWSRDFGIPWVWNLLF
jgi:hypothetical protein